jgi:phosphoglycolate phosphatase
MQYTSLLFDLDGVVTDPYEGIAHSIQYALGKFAITENDTATLKAFIGPPLEKSFREYYTFGVQDAKRAVAYYREYFAEKGIYENEVYPGMVAVLEELNNRNKICILATSKPDIFAKKILRHFNLDSYFAHIVGSNLDGTLSEKEDIIKHCIEMYHLHQKTTVMTGDRKYDIAGAHKNGIDAVGVLYGYGSREELEQESPEYIIARVMDLPGIIV